MPKPLKALPPGDHLVELPVGSLSRRALVHVPSAGDSPRPVVVVLHGAGGTGKWTRDETGWDAVADREGFVVAYPDGVALDPEKPPHFLDNPQLWNAGFKPGMNSTGSHSDIDFLTELLDELARRNSIGMRRVYVTGFSNGAAMAFRLAAECSDRIAAIAPVSGYCPLTPKPTRPVPTLYIVGDADPLVPLTGGELISPWSGRVESRPTVAALLAQWADRLGLPPEPRVVSERNGGTIAEFGSESGTPFTWVTVEGLGHHWPGGRGRLNPAHFGKPSDRLRATDTIWEFFRGHALV